MNTYKKFLVQLSFSLIAALIILLIEHNFKEYGQLILIIFGWFFIFQNVDKLTNWIFKK